MKAKTDYKKLYNNFSAAFIVVSLVLIIHILNVIFTAGFLYLYFGQITGFNN